MLSVLRVESDHIVISDRIQLAVLRTGRIPKVVLRSECSDLAKFKKCSAQGAQIYFKKVLSFERSDIALKSKKVLRLSAQIVLTRT